MTHRIFHLCASVLICGFISATAAQRAAQTFDGIKMAQSPLIIGARNAELVAPPTVDPPEITLEITPRGHHYSLQSATDIRGPWRTHFTRQNEYTFPTLRVTIYKTNTAMFYRSEVVE
jgi:hypothetical protein